MTTTTGSSASTVAAQIASAWRRWHQRSMPQAASSAAQRSADEEAQFELVAVGLAAAISDAQLEALFASSSDGSGSAQVLSLLLPLEPAFAQDPQQFHFTLVVVAKLFALYHELELQSASVRAAAALESDRIVRELLLPLLQRQRYARVHAVAITMLEQIVQSPRTASAAVAIETLASDISAMLAADASTRAHTEAASDSAVAVPATRSDDDAVSYSALCGALQLLLERSSSIEAPTSAALIAQTKRVCLDAIARFATAPLLLRAVATQLVPSLLRLDASSAKALTDCAVATWRAATADRFATAPIANVLYVLCLLVPSDPTLVCDSGVQDLVAFALASTDALLRKQSMFVLHAAFAHYASEAPSSSALATWQRFLTASDVIQMHEQLHLLEQVWPHVTELLEASLVVYETDSSRDTDSGGSVATTGASAWPVSMSFDWLQSLLLRVFSHENPLVRRTFMQRFMDTCVAQWDAVGSSSAAVDPTASFACSASFHAFVQTRLLRALNDAQMYKTSTKDAFMRSATAFLAAYLAFTLTHKSTRSGSSAAAATSVLSRYVDAVQDAVFGTWGASGHSPEALVSMLSAFHSHALEQTVRVGDSVDRGDLLNERALDQLRIMMEFRVMRSFPQSIRLQITHAIVQALTGGFTDAAAHSLYSLASVLLVLPLRNVVGDDGSTYVQLHRWLRAAATSSSADARFESALRLALTQFVRRANDTSSSVTNRVLGAHHLSRLLLFMSDVRANECSGSGPVTVALATPLASLVASDVGAVDSCKLLALVGTFEADVAQVQDLARHTTARFQVSFTPRSVYEAPGDGSCAASVFSSSALFALGLRESSQWLNRVQAAAAVGSSESARVLTEDDDDDDEASDRDDAMQRLTATALVVTQMATYAMEQTGDLTAMDALDRLCVSLKQVLAPETSRSVSASDVTLAMQFLAVVASRSTALDSLQALQGESTLPLLLAAQLPASTANTSSSSKRYKRCAIQFFESRWTLIHSVLGASSYIPTPLLQQVFTECLDALTAVGADPSVLYELVQVLALALQQLAATVVRAADRDARLDALFETVWGEYSACLAKPDALTRAVVSCLFQPAFLLAPALCEADDALMKRWVRRVLAFGQVHRPNVVFHLTCRLAQVWRAQPSAAHWFVDEIATLLLYREPVIGEKEQLTLAPGSAHGSAPARATAAAAAPLPAGVAVKDRFVRLIVLSLLDEMSVESASEDAPERALVETLIMRLLERHLTDDWCKQHMVNSDGFGQKLRCWQALCVLSKHVRAGMVEAVNRVLWRAFVYPHVPAMRYYMELFAMRVVVRFPDATIRDHVVPLLHNVNLTPQVGASLLLVAGYAVHSRLDAHLARDRALCALLIDAMVPWLNASHGHTRILVQFLLAVVLPRYLHQETAADAAARPPLHARADMQLLVRTASFLSENKEAKRMHRRQLAQLRKFRPEWECSLLGVLASAHVNEFLELVPSDDVLVFSAQFKDTMNALHAQFNREHFVEDAPAARATVARATSGAALGLLNVQRKIDTRAVLLADSVLPVAMQARAGGTAVDAVNARNKRRQPVILCASLVDKTPNLAGLARTCEIFNAQALVVPNARVCDDELFGTISVTANKWMPIEQVRPDQGELVRALERWKRDGYTIVALEQTASSVCLSSFAFPEKIVIVLGKEKEGVPVDVLQMVDVCVEIPQFGLIRSLNVHVSGAILLWEYTQQRMLQRAVAM